MGRTILFIEDSPWVQRLVRMSLRELEVDVHVAADATTGLQKALELLPSVIILDIGLPGPDGWEFLGWLRDTDATEQIPVLVLTAHVGAELPEKARRLGAQDFMNKPFQPNELVRRVHALMEPEPTD